MSSRYEFIVELTAPANVDNIGAYYDNIKALFEHTKRVSITSKPVGPISGFDRSYNLARFLLAQEPNLDILFHVTCKDLNKINIHSRLSLLKLLNIRKILVVTGDDYSRPEVRPELHYSNSEELVERVANDFGWFDSVAVAGYPAVANEQGSASERGQREILGRKLALGADTVCTQCVFDSVAFDSFERTVTSESSSTKVIPSVAVFQHGPGLQAISRLARVSAPEALARQLSQLTPGQARAHAKRYLVELCRRLRGARPALTIVLCTFGLFELTQELIRDLRAEPGG